jgi:small-conductance mechanosensitive channel
MTWETIARQIEQHGVTLLQAGLLTAAWWLLKVTLHRALDRFSTRRGADQNERLRTLTGLGKSVATTVLTLITVVSLLSLAGINTAPIVTGAGVLGVAVGLGTQHLIRDLVAGITLLTENQFVLGEEVEIAGRRGRVENITLRCVHIRAADGVLWSIPSGEIKTLGNHSRPSR